MTNNLIYPMWQEAQLWRLIIALLSGAMVSYVYFHSLRWCVNHLHEFKHKYKIFFVMAFLRILLFFSVMVLVAGKNIVLVLLYLATFFAGKFVVLFLERRNYFVNVAESVEGNSYEN